MSQKIVSVDDDVPFEAWVLPDVGKQQARGAALAHHVVQPIKQNKASDPNVTVSDDELSPSKITVSEIESIREQAHLEGYEAGREAGHEVGVKEGHQEGYEAGLKQAEQEIADRLARLDAMMSALAEPMLTHQQRLAEAATLTGLKVAESVLPSIAKQSPESIVPVVQQALSCLSDQPGSILIKVNPADKAVTEELISSFEHAIEVIESDSVSAGGCLIKADATQIDAYLETRLEQVASELKERIALAMNASPELAPNASENQDDSAE